MTDIRSSTPAQSWRNRSNWTQPDCYVSSDSWGQPSSDRHNWIPIGCTHMVLVPCSSCPGAGPQHIASQGNGRTPHSSWLTPRADSCLCAYICTPTNTVWGAGIQSIATSSSVLLLVCKAVCLKEREHTTRQMLKCYTTDCRKKTYSWDPTMT